MKMKPMLGSLTAVMLALSIGSAPVLASAGDYYPEKDHPEVSYDDMAYEGVDTARLDGYLKDLSALAAEGGQNDARLTELYGAIVDEFDHLFTQEALCYIAHSRDGNDKAISDEYEKIQEVLIDANDRANVALSEVSKTTLAPALEALIAEDVQDEELAADIMDKLKEYEPLLDREKEIAAKLAALRTEYNEASLASYTVEVDGRIWTTESFEEDPPRDNDEYYAVMDALSGALNEAAADIYLEMIPLLNEEAVLEGYDNYADYANAEAYERDYSSEEQQKLAEDVRTYLMPLMEEISMTIDSGSYRRLERRIAGMTADDMLDLMAPYVGKIDPELRKSFDALRSGRLYDMDFGDSKLDVGYTIGLDEYGTAFIFNSPYGSFSDFSGATVHEFGHFNEAWHTVVPSFWQTSHLDVSEISSQGLETLFLEYAEDMFGRKAGRAYRDGVIYNLTSAVLMACMVNDFETTVFTSDETWTRDSLNQLFFDLCTEYDYAPGSVEECYWWAEIPHLFESPLYYMAYGTSALGAMDIACEALRDRDKGVDKYMRLTALASMYPLRESLEKADVEDIFSEGAVERIADAMRELLDLTARQGRYPQRGYIYIGIFAAVLALIAVAFIFLVGRARRRPVERGSRRYYAGEEDPAFDLRDTGGFDPVFGGDDDEPGEEAYPPDWMAVENDDTAVLAAEQKYPADAPAGTKDVPYGQDGV